MTGWHLPRFPSMYVGTAMTAMAPTIMAMMTPIPKPSLLLLLLLLEGAEGHLQ